MCPLPFLALLSVLLAATALAAPAEDVPVFAHRWGGWGSGPGQVKTPTGLAAGPNGEIYVADTGNHRIQVFDAAGGYLRQWGSYGTTPGRFIRPSGIAISAAGWVYVVEGRSGGRVQVFTPAGAILYQWSGAEGAGPFEVPLGIGVDPNGDVYVADTGNHRVQKFTFEGQFVASWGTAGSAPGEFMDPSGIACDRAGNVFVADQTNSRIQKFTAEGTFVAAWSYAPLVTPFHITIDANDDLYVTSATKEVVKIAPSGALRVRWGAHGPGSSLNSKFPTGIAVPGHVFVAESVRYGGYSECYINTFRQAFTSTAPARWGALKTRYR